MDDLQLPLFEEIDLGSARGGKRRPDEPLQLAIIRELTNDDLPLIIDPPKLNSNSVPLSRVRQTHHHLAQLLAKGDVTDTEASLITGYSTSRISILRQDHLFKQLLESYQSNRQAIFVDVLERMKNLGLASLDELQARLDEEPEKFTKRELMEMANLLLVKPAQQGNGNSSAGPAISLNVKFVSPNEPSIVDVTRSVVENESHHSRSVVENESHPSNIPLLDTIDL